MVGLIIKPPSNESDEVGLKRSLSGAEANGQLLVSAPLSQRYIVRTLGLQNYETVWRDMQQFTQSRCPETGDEIWLVEHPPVFTLGLSGRHDHILDAGDIPVIHTDRGGQATYHGPGQLVVYALLDLKRNHLNIRQLVTLLENAMINTLAHYGIMAFAKADAPGVYVADKKIGSVGLRIKNNASYHGLSLNHDMDLSPFKRINPCGYPGLEVTQVRDFGTNPNPGELATTLINFLFADLKTLTL
jgi:lipoyl(octanoyl) transferase